MQEPKAGRSQSNNAGKKRAREAKLTVDSPIVKRLDSLLEAYMEVRHVAARKDERDDLKEEIRDVGRELAEAGGIDLMHEASDAIEDCADGLRKAVALDHRWDGIGGWCA